MTESLKNIYEQSLEIDINDCKGYIDFYEANRLLLQNTTTFSQQTDFENILYVHSRYAYALEGNGRFSKAIDHAINTIKMGDSTAAKMNLSIVDNADYNIAKLVKGRAQYNLKQYNKAIETFADLVANDPENENFQNWLNESKARRRSRISKYLLVTGTALVLVSLLFPKPLDPVVWLIARSGLVLILLGIVNEYLIWRIFSLVNRGNK